MSPVASSGAATGEPHAETRARAAEVLAHHHYQTELPEGDGIFVRSRASSLGPLTEQILIASLWLVGILAATALLVGVTKHLRKREPIAPPEVSAGTVPPPPIRKPTVLDATLADADRAAAAGEFAMAIHILLMIAISASARRTSTTIRASMTSRELRAILPLAGAVKDRFATLVDAVERSVFARRRVEYEDYARCRGCCEEILTGTGA